MRDRAAKRRYESLYWRRNKAILAPKVLARSSASRVRRVRRLELLVREAKAVPCSDCGNRHPYYVMDFDHRDPETKVDSIADLVAGGQQALVIEEMKKCDVVCSNCHRERTHQRRLAARRRRAEAIAAVAVGA